MEHTSGERADAVIPPAYFTGRDRLGHEITLRRPATGELLCGTCLSNVVERVAYGEDPTTTDLTGPRDVDLSIEMRAELDEIAELALREVKAVDAVGWVDGADGADGADGGRPEFDPLEDVPASLYPPSGALGHDCAHAFTGPVWLIRQPDCSGTTVQHLTGQQARLAPDCRCGMVGLYEALEHLDPAARQEALNAHLAAMGDMYDHLMAAETLLGGVAAEHYLPVACLACLADPAFHVEEIDEDLTARTLELAPVLRAYDVSVTVGERRPAGPLTGPSTGSPGPTGPTGSVA